MKVLFMAAEATPWIKVGGLGDVAGALPQALRNRGMDVRLLMPRYYTVDPHKYQLKTVLENFPITMDWHQEECLIRYDQERNGYFVENDYYFGSRDQAYGYRDDAERFVLFARAGLEFCRRTGWYPDIIHAHDWHSAAAIRLHWAAPERAALVFTIHNIAHQGYVSNSKWPLLGVYDAVGNLNLMEQAIYGADIVTTVSPTYAREIRTPEYGFGLEDVLRGKGDRVVGILNGLDYESWNPATDPAIAQNFSADEPMGKLECKRALQEQVGLPQRSDVPLIGVVSRLDSQKGIRLILDSMPELLSLTNAQIMFLGSGSSQYESEIHNWTAAHGDRVGSYIGFNGDLARRIYAGSDMFLMPSSFEPCGLSQLMAMRYGSLPIARSTGGLADTIINRIDDGWTGYLFGPYEKGAMLGAIGRALNDFPNSGLWTDAVKRAMRQDFSWQRSAARYEEVFNWALEVRG
ncbi:MAG TPA: glycogen synthase [Phycisphaerales bacterium]|nr:glycogen synthase [Phycisphaerales bacterium]